MLNILKVWILRQYYYPCILNQTFDWAISVIKQRQRKNMFLYLDLLIQAKNLSQSYPQAFLQTSRIDHGFQIHIIAKPRIDNANTPRLDSSKLGQLQCYLNIVFCLSICLLKYIPLSVLLTNANGYNLVTVVS